MGITVQSLGIAGPFLFLCASMGLLFWPITFMFDGPDSEGGFIGFLKFILCSLYLYFVFKLGLYILSIGDVVV
jgi:hypothetical protein